MPDIEAILFKLEIDEEAISIASRGMLHEFMRLQDTGGRFLAGEKISGGDAIGAEIDIKVSLIPCYGEINKVLSMITVHQCKIITRSLVLYGINN